MADRKFSEVFVIILASVFAVPVTYVLNNAFAHVGRSIRPIFMTASASITLTAICTAVAVKVGRAKDWLCYAITLFAFTFIIDGIIALELHGLISNFMSEYVSFGEPYLLSPYGVSICAIDALVLYPVLLYMALLLTNGEHWRSVGMYWTAAIMNSMAVIVVGIASGKEELTVCTLLNIPYVVLPIFLFFRAFQEHRGAWDSRDRRERNQDSWLNVILTVGLTVSTIFLTLRGIAALGGRFFLPKFMVQMEPILTYESPARYGAIQAIMFLFYIVPTQLVSLCYVLQPEKPAFLWDLALIQAGIVLHGQLSYLATTISSLTPVEFQSDPRNGFFCFINILTVAMPHIFLLQLSRHRQQKKSN